MQAKREKNGTWKKLTYNDVKQYFEEQGCILLSKKYVNARIHLDYKCVCGNEARIIYDSFRRGHRCRKCGSVKMAKSQTFTYEQVRSYIEELGCMLVEKKYTSAHCKMKIICRCGDIYFKSWNAIQQNHSLCFRCSVKGRSGSNHYEWKKDRKQHEEDCSFRQRSYKMLKHALNSTGQEKIDRSINMLGYTHMQLRDYIKNHSNWDKVKNRKWHLDHIFPIKAFLDFGIKDIKLINCLENLQPLSAAENRDKSDKYDENRFKLWLQLKGVAA
tara:strand:- start:399 stop:1214 length:816 start_codon:yes stop_codon:yes gene_type:complete